MTETENAIFEGTLWDFFLYLWMDIVGDEDYALTQFDEEYKETSYLSSIPIKIFSKEEFGIISNKIEIGNFIIRTQGILSDVEEFIGKVNEDFALVEKLMVKHGLKNKTQNL